jgi:hypothetical protein
VRSIVIHSAGEKYTAAAVQLNPAVALPKTLLYWATWGLVDPYPHFKIVIRLRQNGAKVKTIDYRDHPNAGNAALIAIGKALATMTIADFEEFWINRDLNPNTSSAQARVTLIGAVRALFHRRSRM